MHQRWPLVSFILVASVLAQCSCGVNSEKELVGKYRVDNEEGYAILMLRPDKTYLQTIHYADARKEITATGRWDFDAETQLLTLRDSYGVSSYAFGRKSDAAGLPVYKVFGTVRLTADGDYGLVYKKLGD